MTYILRGLGVLSGAAFLLPGFLTPYGIAASVITAVAWFAFAAALEHLRAIRSAVESIDARMLNHPAIQDQSAASRRTTQINVSDIALAEQAMKAALRKE